MEVEVVRCEEVEEGIWCEMSARDEEVENSGVRSGSKRQRVEEVDLKVVESAWKC